MRSRAGGGARPRQRRPGPARVVLPGFARLARSARHRLRHPLRVRHLRPDHPRRLAGGDHRQVAALWQPVGDRAAGNRVRSEVWRTHRGVDRRAGPITACAGFPRPWSKASPTTRRSSATASAPATSLRLWKAEAVESFDFAAFNHGDYYRAVEDKMHSENITKVLYPNDEVLQGKTCASSSSSFSRAARCRT